MAIEDFGESLLQQQRDRNRRRRKEEERAAYIGSGLNIVKKLANTFLEEKTRNFMQREDVQSSRQVARGADNTLAFLLDYDKRVADSGLTAYQYELELAKPIAQQYIQEQNADAKDDTSRFNALVNEMAATVANKKLGLISEMRGIAQQAPESGSYVNRLDLIQKRLRPSNIQEGVTSFLRGMVDGMSNEDMELRQLAALKEYSTPEIEGPSGTITLSEAEQAKRLNRLMTTYNRTRNLTLSTNYADNEAAAKKILALPDGTKTEEVIINVPIRGSDGKNESIVVTRTITPNGDITFDQNFRQFDPRRPEDLTALETQNITNMTRIVEKFFDEDGIGRFYARLAGERTLGDGENAVTLPGIAGLNPTTHSDYARMLMDFTDAVKDTSNYKKDDNLATQQNQLIQAVGRLLTAEVMKTLPTVIVQGTEDQKQQLGVDIGLLMNGILEGVYGEDEILNTERRGGT